MEVSEVVLNDKFFQPGRNQHPLCFIGFTVAPVNSEPVGHDVADAEIAEFLTRAVKGVVHEEAEEPKLRVLLDHDVFKLAGLHGCERNVATGLHGQLVDIVTGVLFDDVPLQVEVEHTPDQANTIVVGFILNVGIGSKLIEELIGHTHIEPAQGDLMPAFAFTKFQEPFHHAPIAFHRGVGEGGCFLLDVIGPCIKKRHIGIQAFGLGWLFLNDGLFLPGNEATRPEISVDVSY